MTYVRTGTITVKTGSQIVSGIGTRFVLDQVIEGDQIQIDDSGIAYGVSSVNGNTILGLDIPYKGVSGSGKRYVIIPVQGHNHDLAQKARELIRQYEAGVVNIDQALITHQTGQSEDKVISQKGVTNLIGDIESLLIAINGE